MKKGIIVASFGTTYEDTRRLCIESIENRIKEEYEDFLVIRAFTSQMVINILKKRDDIHVFNPKNAMEEMRNHGIEEIYIQPLHIIQGHEYEKLTRFDVKVGLPLLSKPEDYINIVEGLDINDLHDDEALVFMGHGSNHEADEDYKILESTYHDRGFVNVLVGTVEGSKGIEDIIAELKSKKIKKVRLKPFMLVAGDHVTNDLASNDEDSWKSILEREGFKVEVCLKALGEYKVIQDIFLAHLGEVVKID